MSRKTTPASAALCLLGGVACAMAFGIDPEGAVGVSETPAAATNYLWTALALAFAWGFDRALVRRGVRVGPGAAAFGLLFGVVNYFATTLFAYDTWSFLSGPLAWGKAGLCCIGQALPMAVALAWLQAALCAPDAAPARPLARFRRLRRLYREHTILCCALFFALCWSPFLLAFWPGTVVWDMGEMIAQFFGQRPMDTWHPVFTTWVFGGCVWLGRLAGGDNSGAFLFTLLQTALLAYALGACVRLLRRLGLGRGWQLAAIALFGLTPIFGAYAQTIGKDTLYAALLLLFTLETLTLLRCPEERPAARRLIGYGAVALLTCLTRSNGVYVVLPTAMLTVIFGRHRLRVGAALAGALAVSFAFTGLLLPALGVKDETASGLYSVCFQQSARLVRDHRAELTQDEYAAIDQVLAADQLAEKYEPVISDPVKFTFRQYGTGAENEKAALAEYRAAWLQMGLKYPVTYLEAFIAGNSGYYSFIPKIDSARTYNYQGGLRFVFETYELGDDPRFLHTAQLPALAPLRSALAAYARGWRHIPALMLLLCCPVYVWALVGAGLALARQKRWRLLISYVPALLSLGVCLLSPVNDYFRYFLPIAAMAPALIGLAKQPASRYTVKPR